MSPNPAEFSPPPANEEVSVFNLPDLVQFVNQTVLNYYSINGSEYVNDWFPEQDDLGNIMPISMFLVDFNASNNNEDFQFEL